MLDFPPLFNLGTAHLVLLFCGAIFFCYGIYYIIKFARFVLTGLPPATVKEIENKEPRGWLCLPIALLQITVGAFFLLVIAGGIKKTFVYRSIPVDQVSALEIKALDGPYATESGPVKAITDRVLIQKGLRLLSQAEARDRDHEHYTDGYIIHFVGVHAKNDKDFFLAVYKKSSRKGKAAIVIPATGKQDNWGISTIGGLGEYSCPAFLDWVTANVDPLFKEEAGKAK